MKISKITPALVSWMALLLLLPHIPLVSTVSAQAPPEIKNIDEVQAQIQALQKTVDEMRRAATNTPPPATTTAAPAPRRPGNTNDPIYRIREEGMNNSKVMDTLCYLSDVIGPRLTGSPNAKRANEWTREKLTSWGLVNAKLEPWGPFGRGWSLKRFSAEVIEPQAIPLKAFPAAWSPGFDQPLTADVVYLDAKSDADLDKYKGKLKDAIVLVSSIREVRERFDPLATRLNETNLLDLANAPTPSADGGGFGGRGGLPAGRARFRGVGEAGGGPRPTNFFRGGAFGGGGLAVGQKLAFLASEGAALAVMCSSTGDGGTLFVQSATAPSGGFGRSTNAPSGLATPLADGQRGRRGGGGGGGGGFNRGPSVWATNAPAITPQITVAVEDYNRMVRMVQAGEKLKMAVDLEVQFHDEDLMSYNTVAEIPGSDLKDEIVMVGAHMDSWQSGTGATDNGAGVAACMEAVRIIKALNLKPRRTIRIGLWTGEEEGLMGSRAYVSNHFGYFNTPTNASAFRSPREASDEPLSTTNSDTASRRKLVKKSEYDKLSVYFNIDNGAGKIRGIYLQGNESVRPLFRRWIEPFIDLDAETVTSSNTGSTDHVSYDGIGLPGFQFIQDPLDYTTRTHHSNEDVFDRIQADDMKQMSVILATFAYKAATIDEKIPRKPVQ